MPSHLRDESPRVTNAIEVINEDVKMLLLRIKWLTQRLAPIFSLELKDEWMECERGWEELFSEEWSVVLKLGVRKMAKRGEGVLLYPLTQKLSLGCQRPGLVRMESFWIQTIMGRRCRPKPTDGHRQATREPGGPEPLSVGLVARTRPEVEVRWACHLTYTWSGRCLMCFS
jgi:hypothetical protein